MAKIDVRVMKCKTTLRGMIKKQEIICYDDFFMPDLKTQLDQYQLLEYTLDLFDADVINAQASDKVTNKYLNAIEILVGEYNEKSTPLDKGIPERIESLRPKLIEMLEASGRELTVEMDKYLERIKNWSIGISITYPGEEVKEEIKEEVTEEEVTSERITELEKEIAEKEALIKEYKTSSSADSRQLKKYEKRIETLEGEVETLKEKVRTAKEEKKELEKQVRKQSKEIETLSETASKVEGLIASNERLERFNETLREKANTNSEQLEELKMFKLLIENKKLAEEKILEALAKGSQTLDQICAFVKNAGIILSKEEILECLNNLRTRYSIFDDRMLNLKKVYGISTPTPEVNKTLWIDPGKKCMDIIAISDLHMGKISERDIKVMDTVYDYASKVGSNLIINLGDLFSFNHLAEASRYDRMKFTEDILTEGIEKLPQDRNITHAILGGNHDRQILDYGINPIDYICREREDIISLGYDHARLNLKRDTIMLHHMPLRFDETEEGISTAYYELLSELSTYYRTAEFDRTETYVNMFGHFHKASISEKDGIVLVPSLMEDRFQDGIYHMKVYFDTEGKIENIIYIPLILLNRATLVKTGEQIYKKR